MLQAITPSDDIYDFRYNLQKKSNILNNPYQRINILPVIKTFKDQTTSTDDVKTCMNFNNQKNKNVNETSLSLNITKRGSTLTSFSNNGSNINYQIRPKFFFNKNFKLKSLPPKLIKSNSSSNMNTLTSNRTLGILNIPAQTSQKRVLKQSASQPKLNINKEYFENNKCNYLVLKYTGIDKSKNEIKKKKYLVINSHKVINSLKSYSMPNDIYGTKIIDIIQQRINSGYYRNYKINFSQKYQSIQLRQNDTINNKTINTKQKSNKKEEQKFDGNFLKDIYDKFLLPGPDNKYNYTIHKIFLSQVLEKVFKKMVEIRDKSNKVVTKEEIRQEFNNEVDNLRNTLLTGKDFKIINNIYNINNNLNIVSIELGRNQKLNDMGVIDESVEKSALMNSTLEERDKDKQSYTSNFFDIVNKTIKDDKSKRQTLENVESNYKIIHKEDNNKLLSDLKDKMRISNKSTSIHDTFLNFYINKLKLNSKKFKNKISTGGRYSKRKYIPALTSSDYYEQEEELNNVQKFILNTKKLRYTLNIKEKEEKENERNLSYDAEGNVKNYFEVGLKLNQYFFEDILDEIEEQYYINNHVYEKVSKNEMLKEILKYYLHKKGVNLKFNDKISKKYLSELFPKTKKTTIKKQKKEKSKKKPKKEKEKRLITEIAKKIHKKIHIKIGRALSSKDNKYDKNRQNNTEDNFYQKKRYRIKNNDFYWVRLFKNEKQQQTEHSYLEIETNSSEFSDLPSEVDSEVFEMIKKKKEKEKNKDKDVEEGLYGSQPESRNKGGDFIINNYTNKTKEKKEEEEEKKENEEIDNKDKDKDRSKKNTDNLNAFLNINEKGEIEEKTKEKPKEEKKYVTVPKKEDNKDKQKQPVKEKQEKKDKEKADKNKDIKSILNDDKKNKDININKSNSIIESDTSKSKKDDSNSNIITSKNTVIKLDIKSPIKKKMIKKELERITEEENKETKATNKIITEKTVKKETKETKETKEEKKETKEKKEEKKEEKKVPVINDKTIFNNNKKEKSVVSLYKNIKIEKNQNQVEKKENEETDKTNEIKNASPSIEEKYNNNESSINPTSDHLSIVGVMNNINIKDKTMTNNSKIEGNKSGMEEEFESDKENNNDENSEELLDAKNKKNISFHIENNNEIMILETSDIEEKKIPGRRRRNSLSLNQSKNFKRIKFWLEKYSQEKIKKSKEEDEDYDDYNLFKDEKNWEDEGQKKERRKRKTRVSRKSVDFRQFFIDEKLNEEVKEKKLPEKKIEYIPKKEIWEDKFRLFKLYINKLKGMNQEEFKNDLFKFLHEEDKIDFGQKERLNMVDRINKYKAFIISSKKNKLLYNRFHSSRILFAPGCIFNTDNIF